ncbi:MAG: CPBP family glutamic-type intramembrane protease, partial [Methanobacterium sp.]
PLFFVATLGISFILAWLRLKSGSIWPAVLLHASHNLFIQQFFDPLSGGFLTKYLVGETGVLLVAIIIIFALVFWMMRDKLPDIRITPAQT